MFVTQPLNELAKLALIASDTSYFTSTQTVPLGGSLAPFRDTPTYDILPLYTIAPGFVKDSSDAQSQNNSNGFKFTAYRNVSSNEVIVAFGGTDGPDPVDWTSNTQLGWNQWKDSRELVFTYLRQFDSNTKIHFTGQSLGGALAQYAAYEWVKKQSTVGDQDFHADFNKTNISLTTFNGIGGLKGLVDNLPASGVQHAAYDSTVLQGLGLSGHFYVTNDLVSRLGGGHVGGNTFLLDFKSGSINPVTHQPYAYDLVDAHRIETGFYANLRPGALLEFQVAGARPVDYLNVDSVQEVAALFGNLLSNKNLGLVESRFLVVAAVTAGLTIGSPSSVNTVTQALITSLHDSGDLSESWFQKLQGVNWGAIFLPTRPVTGAIAILSTLGAVFTDAVQGAASGVSTIFQAIGDYVGAGARPDITVTPPASIDSSSRQLQFEVLMASLGAAPQLTELTVSLPSGLDPEALAAQMLSGGSTDWLPNTLAFARAHANTTGQTPAQLAEMTTQLVTAINHRIDVLQDVTPEEKGQLVAQLNSFTQDTAQGFAKAYSDFLQGVAGSFELGRILSYLDVNLIDQAYAAELSDPRLSSSVRASIEGAQAIVEQAGQTVVVQQGIGANPFNTPGFDPAAAPVATGTVREDGANVFTAYLPYAAGAGGQSVQLRLNGLGANTVTVLSNDQELTPQNGTVTIIVPEGQQQIFFVLRVPDVSANTVLSLNAVLINSAGTATHVEHHEATVSLVDNTINFDDGRPVVTITSLVPEVDDAHHYILLASEGGSVNGELALKSGNDQIYGSNVGELITGGYGHDRLYGGDGNDTMLGGSYFLNQEPTPIPFEAADGDDVVEGQGGDDEIEGDGGHDRLYGGDGSDRLFGDAGTFGSYFSPPGGDDLLDGGAGDDFLWGDYGADILLGGDGNDRLAGDYIVHSGKGFPAPPPFVFDTTRAKDDFLDGGDGADLLYGDGGHDTLVGGMGNDQLYGDYGEGALLAADGDLINIAGNDVLDGGGGDDFIYGMGGDDVMGGGEGGDVIFGDFDKRIWPTATVFGNDVIDAGAGDDFASGGSGNDTLFGGTGNDRLWGDISFLIETTAVGDDALDGGAGDDILFGGRGNDRLEGGDGHDILIGTDHYEWNIADQDVLVGGAGDDRIYGQGGDDALSGGAGTDILLGDDYYFVDQLPGPNVLGPGLLQGLVYSTAPGNDVLDGGANDDFLVGGAGNDTLFGGSGNDFLYGDSGQSGVGGNDRLIGGLGNDVLDGGGGNDIYEFNIGDGRDDVSDSGQGNDTILFGSGIASSSVTLTPDSGRIFVKIGAGLDGILLGGVGDVFGSQTIEQFQFADGTTLTYADLIARGFDISGTGNVDVLFGTDLTNRLTGGLGNDTLFGGLSEDTYFFNSGDGIDLIVDSSTPDGKNTVVFGPGITSAMLTLSVADDLDHGQANVLVIRPGTGADAIQFKNLDRNDVFGPHAVDSFQFADGSLLSYQQLLSRGFDLVGTADSDMVIGTNIADRITAGAGDDQVRSGAGDDLLDGGAGDDQLRGESGNDTYVFGSGSGHDRILDEQGTADIVRLAPGIVSSDVAITRSGDDLVLRLNQGADQLTVAHYFLLPKFRIEEIQFSDGSVLTSAFLDNPVIQGTQQSDVLQGTSGDDALVGLDGNDQISGLAGNDVLDGGTGADQLTGGAGDDTYVIGESGDVVIEAFDEGIDTIQSSITYTLGSNLENLTLTGTSTINGTGNALDNVLAGNSAANVLSGGQGNDTYVVGTGDTVVELTGEGNDTVMSEVSTTLGANLENLTIAGSRSLTGTGNDLDNVMSAPGSISLLAGGLGNDTYVVGPSDDVDVIVETPGGGVDTVRASRSYQLPDNVERLELIDPLLINVSVADPLQGLFLPGMTPTDSQGNPIGPNGTGNSLANTLIGTNQNNILDGSAGADTMIGSAGDDTYLVDNAGDVVIEQANEGTDSVFSAASYQLSVNVENLTLTGMGAINGTGNASANTIAGNDSANVLDGGAGNDFLQGLGGADTYLFARGSGQDTVFDFSVAGEVDTVQFASNVAPTDVSVYQRPGDLVLVINGTTDELTLASFFGPTEYAQKQVRFADGTVWNEAELRARAVDGVPPTGTAGNAPPTSEAGGGDIGTIQSSFDYTLGPNERNLILSESGSPVLPNAVSGTGNELNNIIIGNTGDNILDGGSGDDVLIGGLFLVEQDNHLVGDNGSDILIGGAGDDTLIPFVPDARGFGYLDLNGNNFSSRNREEEFPNTPDDLLVGGQGNDTYVLFNAAEVLFELAGEGVDTVRSTVDYTLGDNLENLTLLEKYVTTPWAIQGVGNDLHNVLVGNVAGNILRGEGGDDTLWGGPSVSTSSFNPGEEPVNPGNDLLIGGAGNDTYLFNRGDGFDTIQDASLLGAGNRIQFDTGIVQSDLTFTQDQVARTLTIQIGSSGTDKLLLTNFDPTGANGSLVVETLAFADGTTASLASLLGLGGPVATNGDDTITTGSGNDVVDALGGNDVVDTGAGNDAITGGLGNDQLMGGTGNDTYRFNVGDGVDTIADTATLGEGNTVEFGAGISSTDLSLGVGSLLIRVGTNGDAIHLTSFDPNDALGTHAIETFRFADGTTLNYSQLLARGFDLTGTTGIDTITGTNVVDRISGLAGNDTVQSGAGDDVLDGGAGADSMSGGTGNDLYVVEDAGDVVIEQLNEGFDTVQSSVSYVLNSNVENLTLTGTSAIDGTGNDLANVLTGNSAANVLAGGDGNDTLTGNAGNDVLNGGLGADVLSGGDGDDLLYIDADDTSLSGGLGHDAVSVLPGSAGVTLDVAAASIEDAMGGDGNDTFNGTNATANLLLQGNGGSDTLFGGAGTDALNGGSGNDLLDGGVGADILVGGTGDDTYVVDDPGDQVTEILNEGIDTVQSSVSYTLGANVENLTLIGSANLSSTGNALNNVLTGNSGNNVLDSGTGADTLVGGAGNDTYVVDDVGDVVTELANNGIDSVQSSITYTLGVNVENLTFTGTAAINGTGNALDNVLTGNSAANTLTGGAGNDTYVVSTGDTVVEAATLGLDTVVSDSTWTLGANVENLTLTGSANINGTGNTLNNVLTGNSGNNTLNGGAGADTLVGGAGNDLYVVDNVGDVVTEQLNEGTDTVQSALTSILGANVENLTLTGTAAVNGTGNSLANTLTGNSAANVLTGGAGDDLYVVGASDSVVEQLNEGTDTVQTAITWTLGANVENLTLTGTAVVNGTGNALNNVLTGNSAANVLTGGAGNDTYNVGAGDSVVEAANSGTDTVQSSVTWTLGSNLDNLSLTGSSATNGTGNSLNNVLIGNSAANVLDGCTGADALAGGAGNDIYVVDNAGDVVTENAHEGMDTVQSSVTYTIGADVENLTLTGSTAINGTGNTLDNVLLGNSANNTLTGGDGNDTLDGGVGNDTMIGGTGNDTYVVAAAGDVVTELANEGTDTVQSSVTYTLVANVENLTLTGAAAVNGTGNALDNILIGNSGANVLTGGAGNDTYVVGTGDTVTEAANAGMDTVQSAVTWILGANIENVTLTGTAAIKGIGNTLNNVLTGNSAANTLTGGAGNDTLSGGQGNDIVNGGVGSDTYLVNCGDGQDTIQDADATAGNSDKLLYGATIDPLDLVISRQANDLRLTIHGSSDQITVQNWYVGTSNRIETIQAGNGQTLLSTQVDQLIQAMAGFTQQTPGLTWNQAIDQKPQEVQTVLAASWQ